MTEWGIPCLRSDRLSTLVPSRTYAGGTVLIRSTRCSFGALQASARPVGT
jgi:hypothetical protein